MSQGLLHDSPPQVGDLIPFLAPVELAEEIHKSSAWSLGGHANPLALALS